MTTPIPTTAPTPADVIGMRRSKPLPVLRTVYAVVIVVAVLAVLRSLAGNEALDWPTVREYFFDPAVMEGLRRTLVITVLAIVIAIVLGVVVANMRLSKNPVLRGSSWTYVWFFRSIPLLVLLVLAYNLSLVYPEITISIPFGPELFSTSTQDLVSPMVAAVAAFGLQQAAYTSEVLRASIQSVPVGQREAAAAKPGATVASNTVIGVEDSHTGEEVIAAAAGPGADQVHGFFANTRLFDVMLKAMGWTKED